MRSIGYPDFVYRPWSAERRATPRLDRTFVSFLTVAQRALTALRKPLKSDYRCLGGAGHRKPTYDPSAKFYIWINPITTTMCGIGLRDYGKLTQARKLRRRAQLRHVLSTIRQMNVDHTVTPANP